jgi:2-polyprenyl-3-methyl-5-hydroxy-6-metoxy-1,4-benzoquinol methylase
MRHVIHVDDHVDLEAVWSERAAAHGARCVANLGYSEAEFDAVTARQQETLLPLLTKYLDGSEHSALDFGCGPGRFSEAISQALGGAKVVAFDICKPLIDLAPRTINVSYVSSSTDELFSSCREQFDVIWVCLVLGGVPDSLLPTIASNLARLLRRNGLLFLVEHTSDNNRGNNFWKFRTLAEYQALFPLIELRKEGFYFDFGQEVGVMVGRKRTRQTDAKRILTRWSSLFRKAKRIMSAT